MSVYYEIKEHLTLQPGVDSSVPYLMEKRIALLGADMLMGGYSAIDTLHVKQGECEVTFSGSEVTPALKEAIGLIARAEAEENTEPVEVELSYVYRWSSGDEAFSDGLGPFTFCFFLDSLEDGELEKLSYVMWNNADCSDDMGAVSCYGVNSSGTLCHGEAEFEKIGALPAEAKWYCEETTFIYDETPFTAEAAAACRALSIAAGNPEPDKGETFTVDGQLCQSYPDLTWNGEDEGEYYLNFVSLPDPESAAAFTAAAAQALLATGREEYQVDLLDLNARLPRMLRITVQADGSTKYEMTKV